MGKNSGLTLNYMAIGSLPHKDVAEALDVVRREFVIPFWPQLSKFNKNEDMIIQFLEAMPGIVNKDDDFYFDNESAEFFEQLEEFFIDYQDIISSEKFEQSELLNKYAITEKNSSTFGGFIDLVKENKPAYAKGQIVGAFTLATSLTDKDGKCAYYDETLREIIVKTLSLKALWQIAKIKEANFQTIPIIFVDEPSLSQLGTSAFITIPRDEVIEILNEVSDLIKSAGALSAIHCCGKCDWSILIEAGFDIINLDGYFFAQNLSLFAQDIKEYLSSGKFIAWGIVPTLDKEALQQADLSLLVSKFNEAIGYLINKGIDKNLLLNQSMITPSCGAGSLPVELAENAMNLTKQLSMKLKEEYCG